MKNWKKKWKNYQQRNQTPLFVLASPFDTFDLTHDTKIMCALLAVWQLRVTWA